MIGLENLKSNPRTAAARDHHPHHSFCTHLYHGRVVVYRPAFWFYGPAGAMSLAGMMIKNAIVLLDQVNIEQAAGKSPYDAVVILGVSCLRPVVLAAATTVLGVHGGGHHGWLNLRDTFDHVCDASAVYDPF